LGVTPKYGFGELHLADLLAGHVVNVALGMIQTLLSLTFSRDAFWGLTRAEAFCGLVLTPASPFFSATFLTEVLMLTIPPLGPGMAPHTQ
jgi:hypothetical protein